MYLKLIWNITNVIHMIKEVIFPHLLSSGGQLTQKNLLSLGIAFLNKIQVNQGEFSQHRESLE